jgi:MFS family permease
MRLPDTPTPTPVEPRHGGAHALRALRHSNYRWYFVGQAISVIGTWVQQVALSWLIYRLTGSAVLLGVTALASQAPQLVIGPFAGIWIDRHDRRRLLLLLQIFLLSQALVLAALTYTKIIAPWHIVAMSLLLGVMNSFDAPLRQSLVKQLVADHCDLPSAIALNSALYNTGRFVGPPIAGILVGLSSEAFCFAVNSLSYLPLIFALTRARVEPNPRNQGAFAAVFREGIAYALSSYPIRSLLGLIAVLNFTASSYVVLMPVFARDVFHGGATTLGWLLGAAGLGSISAAIYLATRHSVVGLVKSTVIGASLAATALLLFSLTRRLEFALALLLLVGFGTTTCNASGNTILQTIVPDHLRGRILSFYTASVFGMAAVGGMAAGELADAFDAPRALRLLAFALLAGAGVFAMRLGELRGRLGTLVASLPL